MNERQPEKTQSYNTFASDSSAEALKPTREQLLSKVMSETLNRRSEDPAALVEALRSLRASNEDGVFDLSVCQAMVSRVIYHRLGDCVADIPMQLHCEVAEALWNNPDGRVRMERFWDSLTPS